jgi:anthranilate phosphoribosyltransferase
MIKEAIGTVVEGQSLTEDQAAQAMGEIMNGDATPAQFGAFVTALRLKGETVEEIAGMARVMREMSLHVEVDGPLVDTCGTGGDASGTFNISTAAGLVVAGAGVRVAKHGNRAMSGACGSADVLESLGVNIDLSPDGVSRCIEEAGFGFMFAQRYHPSMKFAAGPRREIGIRTVFNILGPLTNPAGATAQVIGVADPSMAPKMAEVLGRLGSVRALVVHGADGLDEITLSDETRVWEFHNGDTTEYSISPDELGFDRASGEELRTGSVDESTAILKGVLDGNRGPARDVVLINAAASLLAADAVTTMEDGISVAAESIDSGTAKASLEALVELSQKLE